MNDVRTILPKLYRVVDLCFWSLRMTGGLQGVSFDVDTKVTRRVRRVACKQGWKWQIVDCLKLWECGDWPILEDQEILDESGMDLNGIEGWT